MMKFLQKKQFATRTSANHENVITQHWKIWPALLWLLFGIILLWGFVKLHNPQVFPIQTVNIGGNYQHVNAGELQKIILPYAESGFFAVDLGELKNKLLEVPWIADASVSRVWPHAINIKIIEQRPFARWNDNSLLNNKGIVFSPSRDSFPKNLPQFFGPVGQQDTVLNNYLQMQKILAPLGLYISAVELTLRQAWRIQLSNHIVIVLGRENVLDRLQGFAVVYKKIIGSRADQVNYIDMRYTNGVAVSWKGTPQINDNQPVEG